MSFQVKMRFETAALFVFLLLSGHGSCPTTAFVVPTKRSRSRLSLAVETSTSSSSSKILPKKGQSTSHTKPSRGTTVNRYNKKRRNASSSSNDDFYSIPENVPKLSDMLKSATLQDFKANTDVVVEPSSEQKEIVRKSNDDPELSEVLKSATLEDFRGEIVGPSTDNKQRTSQKKVVAVDQKLINTEKNMAKSRGSTSINGGKPSKIRKQSEEKSTAALSSKSKQSNANKRVVAKEGNQKYRQPAVPFDAEP